MTDYDGAHVHYPTHDTYGRPVRPVLGRSGVLLGYARNDGDREHIGAIGPTPDDAYPRRPMARPLTEPERAQLEPISADPETTLYLVALHLDMMADPIAPADARTVLVALADVLAEAGYTRG